MLISVNKILKLQKRIFYLQKVSGEFELLGKDPVRPRIETLQRDLDTLKSALPTRPPSSPSSANVSLNTTSCHVDGFTFPLMEKSEIERLEEAVRENPYIRDQYVEFLHHKKPRSMTLVQFLPMVFADEALISYNLHGSHASGKSKLSMKGYFIFSSCILEAFESEGLDMNELCNQLVIAIKQSRNRMRQRTFRAKKSIQKLSTKAQSAE